MLRWLLPLAFLGLFLAHVAPPRPHRLERLAVPQEVEVGFGVPTVRR